MKPFFQIMQCVSAPEGQMPVDQFRIVETYITQADGPRTRVTEHSFCTLREAQDYISWAGKSCAHCAEPAVTNLDNDPLCVDHANAWLQGEEMAARQHEEEEELGREA